MTTSRRLPGLTARLYARAARRGKHLLQLTASTSCLLAIFISVGGHWAVLQSIAYTRMMVEFTLKDSLGSAVKKTFDDRYACSLCPKIRDGYNKQRKVPGTTSAERSPEFLSQPGESIFFSPMLAGDIAWVSPRHVDFSNAPPKPPPRAA
jgi:hypothetical protein